MYYDTLTVSVCHPLKIIYRTAYIWNDRYTKFSTKHGCDVQNEVTRKAVSKSNNNSFQPNGTAVRLLGRCAIFAVPCERGRRMECGPSRSAPLVVSGAAFSQKAKNSSRGHVLLRRTLALCQDPRRDRTSFLGKFPGRKGRECQPRKGCQPGWGRSRCDDTSVGCRPFRFARGCRRSKVMPQSSQPNSTGITPILPHHTLSRKGLPPFLLFSKTSFCVHDPDWCWDRPSEPCGA